MGCSDCANYKAERDHYKQLLDDSRSECGVLRNNWQWEMRQRAAAIVGFQKMLTAMINVRDLASSVVIVDAAATIASIKETVEICLYAVNLHPDPEPELS